MRLPGQSNALAKRLAMNESGISATGGSEPPSDV
jgi:hypothetical protein